MREYISPEEQRLVIEKLYRSQDSISSTEKFNEEYRDELGRMGYQTLDLNEFGRKMKKTEFKSFDVERFVKDVTGKTIDLETL